MHQPCDMPKYTDRGSLDSVFSFSFCRYGGKTLQDEHMGHLLLNMTEPRWAWVSVLVTGSGRGWFTDTKQHSEFHSTARHTRRNLDILLVRTFFFSSFWNDFWVKLRPRGFTNQSCHNEVMTAADPRMVLTQLHVHSNGVITRWTTQKELQQL